MIRRNSVSWTRKSAPQGMARKPLLDPEVRPEGHGSQASFGPQALDPEVRPEEGHGSQASGPAGPPRRATKSLFGPQALDPAWLASLTAPCHLLLSLVSKNTCATTLSRPLQVLCCSRAFVVTFFLTDCVFLSQLQGKRESEQNL